MYSFHHLDSFSGLSNIARHKYLLVCVQETAAANSGIQLELLRDANYEEQLIPLISEFHETQAIKAIDQNETFPIAMCTEFVTRIT